MPKPPTTPPPGRLLILGCGYLGRALAESALAAGWEVQALTRNPTQAAALEAQLGLPVVVGDLATGDWHGALDPDGATVVNCVSSGGGGVEGYRRAYLEGMGSLVSWAAGRARQVIYTGSLSVYGDAGGAWIDESTPPTARAEPHQILLQSEEVLRAAVREGALAAATILRLAGLYGPGRHQFLDTLQGEDGVAPGYGGIVLNLIHRDDAVSALLAVAARPPGGCALYNLTDDGPARREEIAAWVAERLGRPAPIFDPARMSERMRRRALYGGRPPDRRVSNRRLRADLGWAPRYPDFRAGYGALWGL